MEAVVAPRCTLDECPVPNGPCRAGHEDVAECPNSEPVDSHLIEAPVAVDHSFRHGYALDDSEAFSLGSHTAPSVIVLAGAPRAGKTTLVAGLYEAFRRGPIGEFRFAGSRTLLGLEERCHLARLASGTSSPDTERTRLNDPRRFLHLSIQQSSAGTRSELLFADVNGEAFRLLRDTGDPGDLAAVFSAASDVAILLDGWKLHDDAKRQVAAQDAKRFMRVCREGDLLPAGVRVQLVLTKLDRIPSDGDDGFVDSLMSELVESVSDAASTVTTHKTAMRTGGGYEPGAGLSKLLPDWVSPRRPPTTLEASAPERIRESHRFRATPCR